SQAAALRCAAESDRILPPQIHIFRIERKYGVGGSVLPYPDESLSPRISRRAPGPLDMHARRKKRPLRHEHSDRQGCKQRQPAPYMILQDVLAQVPADANEQKYVEKMKTAKRLDARQALKALG